MTHSSGGGQSGRGWPRGRVGWIVGSIVLLGVGAIVGLALGSIWLGLFIAGIVSFGWIMAYESSRGRNPDLFDNEDDGARL
jgi:hypothetical protein